MHAAVDYFEAEGLMSAYRSFVVNPCVGGDLEAALLSCPRLRGAHQRAADSLLPGCFVDEPAFDEADGTRRVATVGVGA